MAIIMRRHFREGTTPSLFTYEGAFIAILREDLCLIGWPWASADGAARDVVGEALRQAGAKRPTWAEGQRGFTLTKVKDNSCCGHCDMPLRGRDRRFCSSVCRSRWWNAEYAKAA